MEGVKEFYWIVALFVIVVSIGAYLFYRMFKKQAVLEAQMACMSFNLELLRAAFDHLSDVKRAPLDFGGMKSRGNRSQDQDCFNLPLKH